MALWISDTTWNIADQRTALVRKSRTNQGELRELMQRFQAALKEYRRSRVRRVGEEIESLVSNDQVREVRSKNQRWYLEAKGHQVPPTSDQLNQTSTLQGGLYRKLTPKGENIPILVQQVSIVERPPEVVEMAAAIRKREVFILN